MDDGNLNTTVIEQRLILKANAVSEDIDNPIIIIFIIRENYIWEIVIAHV